MANITIGFITCPITGQENCEVRRYKTGKKKLYYVSDAGMITPNLIEGQAYMKKHTRFINDNGEPLPAVAVNDVVNDEKPVNNEKPVIEVKKRGGFAGFLFDD